MRIKKNLHVIIGSGPVGRATARALIDRGERVRLVSRSPKKDDRHAEDVELVSADATDARELSAAIAEPMLFITAPMRPITDGPPISHLYGTGSSLRRLGRRCGDQPVVWKANPTAARKSRAQRMTDSS